MITGLFANIRKQVNFEKRFKWLFFWNNGLKLVTCIYEFLFPQKKKVQVYLNDFGLGWLAMLAICVLITIFTNYKQVFNLIKRYPKHRLFLSITILILFFIFSYNVNWSPTVLASPALEDQYKTAYVELKKLCKSYNDKLQLVPLMIIFYIFLFDEKAVIEYCKIVTALKLLGSIVLENFATLEPRPGMAYTKEMLTALLRKNNILHMVLANFPATWWVEYFFVLVPVVVILSIVILFIVWLIHKASKKRKEKKKK